MTEHGALSGEDLSAWPDGPVAWDDSGWDDGAWDDGAWAGAPAGRPPQPPGPPWYRSPRLLLTLIGLAAAVLVVAAALLVTGKYSGEIPAGERLDSRTSAAVPAGSASARETVSATATSSATSTRSSETSPTSPSPSSSPSAEPGPEPPPEPAEPAPSAAPPPPASQPRNPGGPRINVTRTPMSFTPGKHGN